MSCKDCKCPIKSKLVKAKSVHKIQLKQKNQNELLKGANTVVLLDGKELYGAKSIKIEVAACEVGKVTIELYASVEMDEATVQDPQIEIDDSIVLKGCKND
jgi:hypothetical protein